MTLDQMGVNEWLLVGGTVIGPVLAVQAQKWVERIREGKNRREGVFLQLMATRQQRLSFDHVRALNSIDIAFYGNRTLGRLTRTAPYQDVLNAWATYRTHLTPPKEGGPTNEEGWAIWTARGDELFVNLLEKLAVATGFDFKRDELQSGSYAPRSHGQTESEQEEIRRRLLKVLRGEEALPLDVRHMPSNEEAVGSIFAMQERVAVALETMATSVHAGGEARSADTT